MKKIRHPSKKEAIYLATPTLIALIVLIHFLSNTFYGELTMSPSAGGQI
jgi:hypothetical protein